jgi:hypothetical protein
MSALVDADAVDVVALHASEDIASPVADADIRGLAVVFLLSNVENAVLAVADVCYEGYFSVGIQIQHLSTFSSAASIISAYLVTTFSWHHFSAISLWILALFLIYVTATEFSHLFGPGELRRLFFTSRPSELQLNRRQRMRELLRLSRLADAHSAGEFRNPASDAHRELVEIVQRLARQ